MRTSLREFSRDLWHLIGDVWMDDNGKMHIPTDEEGPVYQVSVERFEISTQQASAEIARHRHDLEAQLRWRKTMLEEAQIAVAEEHARDLEKVRSSALARLALDKLRRSSLGRIIWWFVEEPLRNLLWAGIIALITITPLRNAVLSFFRWAASLFQ